MDSDNFSSGWYHQKSVVDFRDLKSVRTDIVEMNAAPYRGIVFSFTDAGYTKIAKHLEDADPKELVLILDGHTYSVLEIETLRNTVKGKGDFIVFIADPYSNISNHLISLLVAKLNEHLPKPKGEQDRGGHPESK